MSLRDKLAAIKAKKQEESGEASVQETKEHSISESPVSESSIQESSIVKKEELPPGIYSAQMEAKMIGDKLVVSPIVSTAIPLSKEEERAKIEAQIEEAEEEEASERKEKEAIFAQLRQRVAAGTKLSLSEKLMLRALEEEFNTDRNRREEDATREQEKRATEQRTASQDHERIQESKVSDKTQASKEPNEDVKRDEVAHNSPRTEPARPFRLDLKEEPKKENAEEAEYLELLQKELDSKLSFKERIRLNKLKPKFAPPPIDIPDTTIKTVFSDDPTVQEDYGVTDEALEKQDEKLQQVEALKEEVSSKSPIGFLSESDMRKAIEEKEKEEKAAKLKAQEDNSKRIADVMQKAREKMALDKATQALQSEHKALSFKERLALKKREQEEAALAMEPEDATLTSSLETEHNPMADAVAREQTVPQEQEQGKHETFSINITLNAEQLMAKELAFAGKSFCLIGAAGTGKTSTQRDVAKTLVQQGMLKEVDFKLPGSGGERINAPSIAFCAYTRRASANLARAIHKDPELSEILKHNIMTVHHLLEYEPVNITVTDPLTGEQKPSMRFEPQRHAGNPLEITHLVIEEASMLGLDLWEKLYDALPIGVQIIFIGDINQLPPVFGSSILNYALVQLPVVELKTVYRQAGDSMVLANAHNILKGKSLEEGKGFTIVRGKSPVQVGQEKMSQMLALMFKQLYEKGEYNPEDCMVLSPFNKQALGTDMMNKHIAQFLGASRGAVVYEVLAGMNKHYLAVGDRVMYNKQDGVIVSISKNGLYHGKEPQLPGTDLTRFGMRIFGANGGTLDLDEEGGIVDYSNFSLEEISDQAAERKQQASHVVTIEMETGLTTTLEAAGDFGQQIFTLAYVLTVHKAQGCEWRKVYGILHKDHAVMLNRELFYTMVTRAREEVVLIAKDAILEKAIMNQKIKGDSLAAKIEYFNSGALDIGDVLCTK